MITPIESDLETTGVQEYIAECEASLLQREPAEFVYPNQLIDADITDAIWNERIEEIKALNEDLLDELSNEEANIYAISIKSRNAGWQAKYVGQRKTDYMKQRITEHLITKNSQTGSKLARVQDAVWGTSRRGWEIRRADG